LAAGIILQTGWRGECDLIDPMCGSGTFAIEAALIARGISPGVFRQEYAFEKWPDFDRELFDRIYEDDSNEHEFEHHIYAYDINRHAVEIASTNVKAAGLSKDITVAQQDFKDFKRPEQKSIMVMNPPYGERISSPDLLGLYKMIGERLKHQFHGNDAWVLSYREECFDQIGLRPSLRTPLFNGSLECELRKYQTFEGKFNEMRAQGGDIKTAVERRMMSEKKRFKQNRSFKKGLDEADDEMPVRNFGRDRRERKPFDRKPFDRDGERRGGGERRGFRNDRNDRNDRNEGRREDRKDFRRENRRPRFEGAEKPRRSFDRKGPRPNNRKGNFNRFDNSNRFEDDED
jgi:putative N6-adenine-specific DNA methylase